jgi:hypothetical protein
LPFLSKKVPFALLSFGKIVNVMASKMVIEGQYIMIILIIYQTTGTRHLINKKKVHRVIGKKMCLL